LRSTSDADYFIYQHDVLYLMDADGKNNKLLTDQLDRPVSNIAWSKDSKDLEYLVSSDRIRYISTGITCLPVNLLRFIKVPNAAFRI
jgi:Tol biopolymer transport system component